jgi:hypothetical protein
VHPKKVKVQAHDQSRANNLCVSQLNLQFSLRKATDTTAGDYTKISIRPIALTISIGLGGLGYMDGEEVWE